MNVRTALRSRLGWRLFLSYLIIVGIGTMVLAGTAELLAPAALARHSASMERVLGNSPALVADLHDTVHATIDEILVLSAGAAILAAVLVSLFTTRRIVTPIEAMTYASERIAAGDYHQRIRVSGADELGALARSFNRMAETLEATEQRRLELIGDVAHELRTPLASIQSVMEGLEDGVLPAEVETFAGVQREVGRLQRLVRDLSELSRAEAGQIHLERQAVDLVELTGLVADRLRPQFDDKGVELCLDVAGDVPPVEADAGRIQQVFTNLLGNALQYTPPGGQVSVQVRRDGPEAVVAVRDSGIGIPPEHLLHVFERFYRVDKSRSRAGGGSGIGLTIARHLVEAHGGQIWAMSPGAGQGSTFTFTLPLASVPG